MGTNYYLVEDACPHCGHGRELHIGKSSLGWVFALHVIPEEGLNTLGDWRLRFNKPNSYIKDEYGDRLTKREMLKTIIERKGTNDFGEFPDSLKRFGYQSWEDFHTSNHSVPGPNGLLRSKYADVVPGEGTWDYHKGDFS